LRKQNSLVSLRSFRYRHTQSYDVIRLAAPHFIYNCQDTIFYLLSLRYFDYYWNVRVDSSAMSSTQHDPRILYSVNNIRAFHLQNGEESELTPSGPQTLSLLMVPTASPSQDSSPTEAGVPEEDFYLHLHMPPELDIALPATTQIYHQPPNSYLIPRWDLGPDAGAFVRLEFPSIGSGPGKVTQEDVDTFETILAQCTAFLERAALPKGHAAYNPADYAPGEGYVSSPDEKSPMPQGQIVLVDEEDGSVVGELAEGYNVVEKPGVKPGSKSMSAFCADYMTLY
jgi:spartin